MSLRWDPPTRDIYLLRPEIECPLSIDRTVWPSRFRSSQREVLQFGDDIHLDPATANSYFVAFRLWNDLAEMIAEYRPGKDNDCGVAVSLVLPESYADPSTVATDEWWNAAVSIPTHPSSPDANWLLLGYDIANSGFMSAVSNCGLTEDEREPMRAMWGRYLNDVGLFAEFSSADAFCRDANVRISDDGPFYVFELFLIWGNPRVS
jgi:hypothetical protein